MSDTVESASCICTSLKLLVLLRGKVRVGDSRLSKRLSQDLPEPYASRSGGGVSDRGERMGDRGEVSGDRGDASGDRGDVRGDRGDVSGDLVAIFHVVSDTILSPSIAP